MDREKLILIQLGDKFYLSVPNEIEIGKIQSHCDDMDEDIVIGVKYISFFKEIDIAYTSNDKSIGQKQIYGSVYLIYQYFNKLSIPKGTFELSKDVFDKLRKVLKNYDNIFDVELREYYKDGNFKTDKIKINYEMIKLENPVKNRSYLFRLKDNNIPKDWIEQSEYLLRKLKYPSSMYGNIAEEKVNLINYNGYIPENIDFTINEEYAGRLDDLFKSWNNGNEETSRTKLIKFLFKTYRNQIKSHGDNFFITLNDKIMVLVDVGKLEIVEFKTMYHNIDMQSYNKLVACINIIRNEIEKITKKSIDN